MPFRSASVVRFHFGGYNAGTATTSIGVRFAIDAYDPTALTDVAERVLAGIRSGEVRWAGLFMTDARAFNIGNTLIGSGTHVFSVYVGTAAGDPGYVGTAFLLAKPNTFPIKDLVREEASFGMDGTMQTGSLLYTQTSGTGGGTGTAIDFGAATTGTLSNYVHCFTLNTGTLNVIFESATTATGIFTAHATANWLSADVPTGTILTSTSTINRWLRFRFTNTVASGTFDLAAGAART